MLLSQKGSQNYILQKTSLGLALGLVSQLGEVRIDRKWGQCSPADRTVGVQGKE